MDAVAGQGIVVYVSPSGERGWVVTLFTAELGLCKGFTKGSTKVMQAYQPGSQVSYSRARRLDDQLGTFTLQLEQGVDMRILNSFAALQTLTYIMELLRTVLPEEHAYPDLYTATKELLMSLTAPKLWERVAWWELTLLAVLGYGLRLSAESAVPCPEGTPLTYVSPKSGRAVSAAMGKPYAKKLLPLPHLFGGPEVMEKTDKANAFKLTGYFLDKLLDGKEVLSRAVTVGAL